MNKDFFDERLLYYGLDEFYKKRLIIKTTLMTLPTNEQFLYRMYVYSRAFISDTWKNTIWDYLQDDITEVELLNLYVDYQNKKSHIEL
jgi:hypothetical protein